MNRARVFERALALPEQDRLDLAAELLAATPPPGILEEGSPELREAIEQRVDEVRGGTVKPIPARQALAQLRRQKTRR